MDRIYALYLTGGKIYIGKSADVVSRVRAHTSGLTNAWIRAHLPVLRHSVLPVINSTHDEVNYTIDYMRAYGIDNVRGAQYTTYTLSDADKAQITRYICSIDSLCFRCKQRGHMANVCTRPYVSYIMAEPSESEEPTSKRIQLEK